MINFESDYNNGAHPEILKALVETNDEKVSGYGNDRFCDSAREKIKLACMAGGQNADLNIDVEFIAGGTQTNSIVISLFLKDYEGVVAANTGHVSLHEAGAIEYTGNKVLTVPGVLGKVEADTLDSFLKDFYEDGNREQMVFPGMVYISHPTEYGTLYSRSELEAVSNVCRKYDIPLYLDGARLGYGLESLETDVTLPDIARLCDVFYIGGTKVGALVGEALVFTRGNKPLHFSNCIKRRGALLAKGRVIGVQFDTLFTNGLYNKISRHAIEMAKTIKKLFNDEGYEFFLDSPTNQQFIILENSLMEKLSKEVSFCFWEKYDENHTVVRFATSWATTAEDVCELEKILKGIKSK